MNDERLVCPNCDGFMTFTALTHLGEGADCELRDYPCRRCNGVGTIPASTADWDRRADVIHKERRRRGLTFGDVARAMGISPADVSSMEFGYIDPAPMEAWLSSLSQTKAQSDG